MLYARNSLAVGNCRYFPTEGVLKKNIVQFVLGVFTAIILVVAGFFVFINFGTISSFDVKSFVGNVTLPKLYAVYSGSMEPAIKTGSLVVSLPKDTYNQGDIITFTNGKNKETVTHRLVMKVYEDGPTNEPTYYTAGDANEEFDNIKPAKNQITGKVELVVPYGGYATNFAQTPTGFILLVIVPATIIIYEELKFLLGAFAVKVRKIFKSSETVSTRNLGFSKAGVLLPLIGSFLVVASLTVGYFLDTEKSLGNIIGAGEWGTQQEQTQEVILEKQLVIIDTEETTPTPTSTPPPELESDITPDQDDI